MIEAMNLRWSAALMALLAAVLLAVPPSVAWAEEDDSGEDWEIGEESAAPEAEASQGLAPASAPTPQDEHLDTDPSALTDFQAELEPHGQWVDHPTYGTVWVPDRAVVGKDFAPYVTNGHWALHDDGGWIWVSDYPWGWVTFHYGRWVWVPDVGWAWIAGRQYAHAWVAWRVPTGDYAYVGWAPMPPTYIWVNGVAVTYTYGTYYPWVFCPSYYAFSHHVHHHVVHHHHHVRRIARHTHRYRPPRGKHRTFGPPPRRARVPANATPKKRVPAHPRAMAFAKRKTAAKVVTPPGARGRTLSRRGPTRIQRPASRPRLSRSKTLPSRGVVHRPAPRRASRTRAPQRVSRPAPVRSARPAARGVPRSVTPTRVHRAPKGSYRRAGTKPVVPKKSSAPKRKSSSSSRRASSPPRRSSSPPRRSSSTTTRSPSPPKMVSPSPPKLRSSAPPRRAKPPSPKRSSRGRAPSRSRSSRR